MENKFSIYVDSELYSKEWTEFTCGSIMKEKKNIYKFFPLGSCSFFLKENKGHVIYRADLYAVAEK